MPDFTWADTQPSPEALAEVREFHQLVLGAIATLPAEQQQAVRLHYLDGMMLREIGLLAGVSVGTVKVRLHRAAPGCGGYRLPATPSRASIARMK